MYYIIHVVDRAPIADGVLWGKSFMWLGPFPAGVPRITSDSSCVDVESTPAWNGGSNWNPEKNTHEVNKMENKKNNCKFVVFQLPFDSDFS